jgi:hypothetical protein
VRLIRWSAAPYDATPTQRKNFINVQIDAIGVGLAASASPFLPVYLTRLGASNFQVSLLTSMPAFTGLILAVFVGRFLQNRRRIVPWFSAARLLVLSSYAATGLAGFVVPEEHLVRAVLGIWALATVPQIAVNVSFSVVMNAVAGPTHRYDLMSRRWSILGLTMAVFTALAGQFLELMDFPVNYQLLFIGLSVGGLVSYTFSSRIDLPATEIQSSPKGRSISQRAGEVINLVLSQRDFVYFTIKRFVFLSGISLAVPLFPLYYVREVEANDAWIGIINTAQTAVLLFSYFLWARASRIRGSRFVLLWTTFGLSLYPMLVAGTERVELIAVFAALAGVFQAGLDLVFFDELMKTVPVEYSATFVSLAQSLQYASAVIAPTLGILLANYIGLAGALIVAGGIRLVGFLLFAFWNPVLDKGRQI